MLAPYVIPVVSMAQPGQTSLIQQAGENNEQSYVSRILQGVLSAPDLIRGTNGQIPIVTPLVQGITGVVRDIALKILEAIRDIARDIMRPVVRGIIEHIFTLLHNPNIASPNDGRTDTTISGVQVWYDLVGPTVKQGIRNGFDIMRAIAINLLLLLFIASIWKYWSEAAWKNGHNLMGAVGRLIATTALILFWPVISNFTVQISNEMIDYVFQSIDRAELHLAISRIVDMGMIGAGALLLGGIAASVIGVAAGPAGVLVAATANLAGQFLYFIFLGVTLYMGVSLLVLKAIQTALMLAQFMFAPLFLAFFATQETERVASTFVRACVEVALWTFVWAGLLRILVIVLIAGFNPWGEFLMLLGVLQIMLQVPRFMASAQIGPVSEFLSPGGIVSGIGAIGKALSAGITRLAEKVKPTGEDSKETRLGPASVAPAFVGPGGGGGGQPGGPTPPTGPNGPGGGGVPGHHRRQGTLPNVPEAVKKDLKDNKLSTTHGVGYKATPNIDGTDLLQYDNNASESDKTAFDAVAGLARQVHHNSDAMAAAQRAAGGPDPKFKDNPALQKQQLRLAARAAAYSGALAYWNGQAGNAYTAFLRSQYGAQMPDEMREELMGALSDASNPSSPLHPNYDRNKQTVEGAGLPVNAATMAAANLPGMSRLKGEEFNAAYNALAACARADAANNGIGTLQPGTRAHTQALGRAMAGMSPERKKAAATVGVALMGDPAGANLTDEEIESWVDATEDLVNRGGAKDPLAAMTALQGQVTSRPQAFGVGQAPSPARTAQLEGALRHAVAGALAMKEAGIRPEALSNANLAGQVYDLASAATPAGAPGTQHGRLTPQRMQALKAAAEAKGIEAFTPDDVADVETMVGELGYSMADARGMLGYAQSIREVQGGAANGTVGGNPAPARALPNRALAQRVMALGYGPVESAIELASRPEFEGMSPAQVMVAGRHAMSGAMVARGYAGTTAADASAFLQANGHDVATEIHDMSGEVISGYIQIARDDPAAVHSIPMVTAAGNLASAGAFGGRVARAVVPLQIVLDGAQEAGAPFASEAAAATVVLRMDSARMPLASYGRHDVVQAFGNFTDADMADPAFRDAAVHVASIPLGTLPGGISGYESAVREVYGYAKMGNIAPRLLGSVQLQMLDDYVSSNQAPDGETVRAVVNRQPTGAPGSTLRVHEINLRAHQDLAALPTDAFNQVYSLADNLFSHAANQAAAAGVLQAPDVPQSIGNAMRTMSREMRSTLLAITEDGNGAGLTGQDLVDYVARIRTIGEVAGIREPARTIEYVGRVVQGAASAASVQEVATTLQFLQGQHIAPSILHNPEMVHQVAALPAQYRQPQFAQATARAMQIYSPAGVTAAAINQLQDMSQNYDYNIESISAGDAGMFADVQNLNLGAAVRPTPRFIRNLKTANIAVNANNADRICIAALPPIAELREESQINRACDAVANYLNSPNPHMYTTPQALAAEPLFVQTIMGIERIHDAQTCSNTAYVEQTYQDNLHPPVNRQEHTINIQGRQIRVP